MYQIRDTHIHLLLNLANSSNFQSLGVVDRDSETQLQATGNLFVLAPTSNV